MAEGLISNFFPYSIEVYSAGTKPEPVNPLAAKVMQEIGVDISKNISNHVDDYLDFNFDYVFTVCDNAKEICPIYPNAKKLLHHSFIDPANAKGSEDEKLEVYRLVRDELESYFKPFFDSVV